MDLLEPSEKGGWGLQHHWGLELQCPFWTSCKGSAEEELEGQGAASVVTELLLYPFHAPPLWTFCKGSGEEEPESGGECAAARMEARGFQCLPSWKRWGKGCLSINILVRIEETKWNRETCLLMRRATAEHLQPLELKELSFLPLHVTNRIAIEVSAWPPAGLRFKPLQTSFDSIVSEYLAPQGFLICLQVGAWC